MNSDNIRFPIGKFNPPAIISEEDLKQAITILEEFPEKLKKLTYELSDGELDQPYREGGWTIRQLVHHISDSHHHSYNRFRWALTEDNPMIKAYDQNAFAELKDYKTWPLAWSFVHIEAIHNKLVHLLRMLSDEQWKLTIRHPEMNNEINLKQLAMMYAWHSKHHYAHIENALN